MDPQTSPAPVAPQSNVPETWPGAFGLFKHAKAAFMVNLGPNLVILALTVLFGGALPNIFKDNTGVSFISQIISFVLSVPATFLYLAGSRGQKLSVGQAFSKDFMLYLKFIGLNIIVAASLFVSLLLLIVPFFFVLPRLLLAEYFLLDKKMGVIDAYKASWNATKGHSGKVYGLIGVSILFALACIIIIGIYFLVMYSTAFALLYLYLHSKPEAAAEPVVQSAPAVNAPAPDASQPVVPQAPNLPPQNQA